MSLQSDLKHYERIFYFSDFSTASQQTKRAQALTYFNWEIQPIAYNFGLPKHMHALKLDTANLMFIATYTNTHISNLLYDSQ